jgi:hypothetical protein
MPCGIWQRFYMGECLAALVISATVSKALQRCYLQFACIPKKALTLLC